MDMTDKIYLPLGTNATEKGPEISYENSKLVVRYDNHENETAWIQIEFTEVLTFQFIQMSCCCEEHVVDSHSIMVMSNSRKMNDILKAWEKSVGWQEWQKKQGGPARFKHYRIFFDDVGCVEIVAANCQINE